MKMTGFLALLLASLLCSCLASVSSDERQVALENLVGKFESELEELAHEGDESESESETILLTTVGPQETAAGGNPDNNPLTAAGNHDNNSLMDSAATNDNNPPTVVGNDDSSDDVTMAVDDVTDSSADNEEGENTVEILQQNQEVQEKAEVQEYRELAAIFEEEESVGDKLGNLLDKVQRRLQCAEENDKCGMLYGFKRCCDDLKCSNRLGKGRCRNDCEKEGGWCTFKRDSCCDGLECKKKSFFEYRCQ